MKRRPTPQRLSDLVPDPKNPRTIDHISKAGLARSMEEFGDLSGMVYNVRTSHLVCGHQRKDLLPADAPVEDYTEATDEAGTVGYAAVTIKGRRWPIRFVDWNESQERTANIVANNPALGGVFTEGLDDILKDIEQENPALFDEMLLHKLEDKDGVEERGSKRELAGEYDLSPMPYESYNYVVLLFKSEIDWATAKDHFELKKMRDPTSSKRVGLGCVIDGAAYLNKVLGHLWKKPSKS